MHLNIGIPYEIAQSHSCKSKYYSNFFIIWTLKSAKCQEKCVENAAARKKCVFLKRFLAFTCNLEQKKYTKKLKLWNIVKSKIVKKYLVSSMEFYQNFSFEYTQASQNSATFNVVFYSNFGVYVS